MNNNTDTPIIGILEWEASNNNALSQFGDIPGDIAHPNTFNFPVLYKRITGNIDVGKFEKEIVSLAKRLVDENHDVGAIILECTDLPPFSAAIRRATGLPVFALAHTIYETIAGDRWGKLGTT